MKQNGKITGIVIVVAMVIAAMVVRSIMSGLFLIHDDAIAAFRYWPVMSITFMIVMMIVGQFLYQLSYHKRNRIYKMIGIITASIVEIVFIIESGAFVLSKYGLGAFVGIVIFTILYAVVLWGIAETVSRCRIRHIKQVIVR